MSQHPYLSDDRQNRKENALKAAMPYILDGRRDADALARDGAVDAYGVIQEALRGLWRRVQANLYPMPKEVDEGVPAELADRLVQ